MLLRKKPGVQMPIAQPVHYLMKSKMTLEQFMEKVEQKNTKTAEKWNQYLDNLAILISQSANVDTDIILGEWGYLSEYMIPLGEKA